MHDADNAILELIKNVEHRAEDRERRSEERHKETRLAVQNLENSTGDLRQLSANLTHIFGENGTFNQIEKDVKRHNRYETGGKAIFAVGGLLGMGTVWPYIQRLLHIGEKAAK